MRKLGDKAKTKVDRLKWMKTIPALIPLFYFKMKLSLYKSKTKQFWTQAK